LVFEVCDDLLDDGVITCSASTTLMSSSRLVMKQKWRQSGHSSAWAPSRRVRRTISRRPPLDGFGDLRLSVFGVVDALPGVLVDRLDGGADGLDHPHADRVLPARVFQALEHLGVPEPRVGPQQLDAGRAGARPISSSVKRRIPF
jgi:hypothetical protein